MCYRRLRMSLANIASGVVQTAFFVACSEVASNEATSAPRTGIAAKVPARNRNVQRSPVKKLSQVTAVGE
jgi:hypothetical protein